MNWSAPFIWNLNMSAMSATAFAFEWCISDTVCSLEGFSNISRIRPYLDSSSIEKLAHAFVSSKHDLNNSLLFMGYPKIKLINNKEPRMLLQE